MTRKLEKTSQIFALEELGLLLKFRKSVWEMSGLKSILVKILGTDFSYYYF